MRIIPTPKPGVPVERVMVELRGYRGAGVYGARYGGGQDLRGLDEEVLGEEGGGRDEYSDRAGDARLGHDALFFNWCDRIVGAHVAQVRRRKARSCGC